MNKRLVVDIDNTLWDFATPLLENLKKINSEVPDTSKWKEWNWWESYMSKEAFYGAINDIHLQQEHFQPYSEAKHFLSYLSAEYHITIASHRSKNLLNTTENWLNKYKLPFHDLHLSYDKSVLFDNCFMVVDDSPEVLEKAVRAGILRTGLQQPWNASDDHPLFNDLNGVLGYIDSII